MKTFEIFLGACVLSGLWACTQFSPQAIPIISEHIRRVRHLNFQLADAREKARTSHRIVTETGQREIFAGYLPVVSELPISFIWQNSEMEYPTLLSALETLSDHDKRDELLLLLAEAISDHQLNDVRSRQETALIIVDLLGDNTCICTYVHVGLHVNSMGRDYTLVKI